MNQQSSTKKEKAHRPLRTKLFVSLLVLLFVSGIFLLGIGVSSSQLPDWGRLLPSWQKPVTSQSRDYAGSCTSLASGPIQVFFTEPHVREQPLLLRTLLRLIQSASSQICCAFYDLESEEVAQALISKYRQGVQVAIVSDTDYARRKAVQQCIRAGIPVVFDERNALMHNKFCIIDGHYVWTGSTNISRNGFYKNNNNAVLIKSEELAVNFINEFEEMFLHRSFGAGSPKNTVFPTLVVGGIPLECYFAPEDQAGERILKLINDSRLSIDFMAFAFTSVPIAETMVKRMRQGVSVRGIFERSQAGSAHSRHDYLLEQGAQVYLDTNPKNMHHKVIIIDGYHVITGSYNFSKNAENRNDENVLILSSPDVASCFLHELEKQLP